jgi:hypothetical protein
VSRHYTVNMNSGVPRGFFGNQESADDYIAAGEVQRVEQAKKGVRFAVGPKPMTVSTPSGRVIQSGQPISAADLHGGKTPAWSILRDLIREARVIEAEVAEPTT